MAIDLNDPDVKKAISDAVTAAAATALQKAEDSIAGVKSKNAELLDKIKANKGLNDADISELKEFRDSKEKAEEDKQLKAGEFDKLKEQILEKHRIDMETEMGKTTKMKASLDSHLIDAAAITAIADAKGSTRLLLPHVKAHLKVIEDNGEFVARVVDATGTVRIGDSGGNPMTIPELVATMKKDDVFLSAFEGVGAGGGGKLNGSGGKVDTSKMTAVEKIAAGLTKRTTGT